jgi:hypothetical protein
MAVLKRATFLRHSTENPTVEAEGTKDGRKTERRDELAVEREGPV